MHAGPMFTLPAPALAGGDSGGSLLRDARCRAAALGDHPRRSPIPVSRYPILPIAPGDRYGRLVVVERAGSSHRRRLWLCRCDCGQPATVRSDRLFAGKTRSCGCLQRRVRTQPIDMSAWRSGLLSVVGRAPAREGRRDAMWWVRCAGCGRTLARRGTWLRLERPRQCADCYRRRVGP